MTFIPWLRQQKDRDDPVGDLARDLLRDPGREKIRSVVALRSRLSGGRVCQGALDAFEKALNNWRATKDAERVTVLLSKALS